MVIDFDKFDSDDDLNCNLCIIGAGAAGITLAKEFNNTKINVILVESGGIEYDHQIQKLYDGETYVTEGSIRRKIYFNSLMAWRLRFFGGTTNHWGGKCEPFRDIDFEKRSWISNSGWPINASDLEKYYRRAEKVMQLSSSVYSDELWHHLNIAPLEFDKDKIESWFEQRSGFLKEAGNPNSWRDITGKSIGSLKFGKEYRDELFDSNNIKVLLHANAVDLITNNDINHVNLLKISNLSRVRESKIIADTFVLCAGGFENPRILLNSGNRDNGGIANNNGLVGKYYLGHPFAEFGTLVTRDQEQADKLGHDFSMHKALEKNLVDPHLRFSNTCLNNNKMLNIGIRLSVKSDKNSGIYSAIQIYKQLILNKTLPNNLTKNMINVLKDIDDVIVQSFRNASDDPSSSYTTSRFVIPTEQSIRIWGIVEQAPISDSKVHLSTNQDELGLNKIIVDWKLNGQEKQTMRRALIILGNEFGRLNIGRVKIDDWLLEDDNLLGPLSDTGIGSHPAGTTRMSTTSVSGVVDVNCRSHFIDNLYISGSSIFPTNSYVSPTHTIVALSIKLADHIKRNLVHKSQT